jgi:hypothetical protein
MTIFMWVAVRLPGACRVTVPYYYYWKMPTSMLKIEKRFEGSDTIFIFRLRKNGRKKAHPFDGNSPERRLSL